MPSEQSDAGTDHEGSGRYREVAVTHHFVRELDLDRLDEWVDANFPEGGVQVADVESGKILHDDLGTLRAAAREGVLEE